MLPNEEFALACRAYYEEQGLIVDKTNGQFAHCPLPKKDGDKGYYLLWEHHQHQGLLQSKDLNKKCFFNADAKEWLLNANYFPDNYFELWDIYEHYTKEHVKVSFHAVSSERRSEMMREQWGKLSPKERSDRGRKTAKKVSFKTRSLNSYKAHIKVIEITFPDGRVGVYPSVNLAAVALGVNPETPRRWVMIGAPVSFGPNKGYCARYL